MIFAVLAQVIFLIQVLLAIYFIMSWFPRSPDGIASQIYAFLDAIFLPILSYLRRFIPRAGMFDLSGLVLFFGLTIIRIVLMSLA